MARDVDITRPRAPQPRRATTDYGEAPASLATTPTTYQGPAPTQPTASVASFSIAPAPAEATSTLSFTSTSAAPAAALSVDARTSSADDFDLDLDLLDAPPAQVEAAARDTWRGRRTPIETPTTQPLPLSASDTLRNQPAPLRRDTATMTQALTSARDGEDAPRAAVSAPLLRTSTPALSAVAPGRASVMRLPAVLCDFAPFPDGWTGPRRPRHTDDGLLFNDLYTPLASPPCPDGFTRHSRLAASPSALQATRDAFPILTAAAALSPALLPLGYLLGGGLGALLALLVIAAAVVAAGAAYRLVRQWIQPRDSQDPEDTARQYIALLRLNLFNHARDLLALPHDAAPVDVGALLDATRSAPLGPTFNTASPVALRDYWRPRLALFDDPAWPLGGLIPRRRWHPGDIHIEAALSRADGAAALLVVQGHKRLSYAMLPLVRVADQGWCIANGELHPQAADTESLRRLAALHSRGAMDDDQLARACAHLNLTRPDINLALTQRLLTERQAEHILSQMPTA